MAEPSSAEVLISSAQGDDYWRRLLTEELEKQGQVRVWDDSRMPAGEDWRRERDAAIAISNIAVVLLSPRYLSSEMAMRELKEIAIRVESAQLRMFTVLITACAWREVPELQEIKPKADEAPLDQLTPTDRDAVITEIALSVVVAAMASVVTNQRRDSAGRTTTRPEFQCSEGVELVIANAQTLARRSNRVGITSSCLLFGLAEAAKDPGDTATFLRKELDRSGGYYSALSEFIRDKGNASRQAETTIDRLGSASANVRAILEFASNCAARTQRRSRLIHQRHLLAALIKTPTESNARRRLHALGVDILALAKGLREHINKDPRGEDSRVWDEILVGTSIEMPPQPAAVVEPVSDHVPGPAGYTTEFCAVGGEHTVPDHLGVEGKAHRLAELIALKETKLPLAVGLFGDWGTGKSHFMNLMDRHLKAVAANCPKDGPWCRQIVPIYFNAWHYLDANLWASLVSEIFDGLFHHLQPKQNALELVRARLREAGGAAALAEEDVKQAQEAVRVAGTALRAARQNRERARAAADGLLDNLETLVPQAARRAAGTLETWLGVSAEAASLSQLVEKHRDMASVPGKIRELQRRVLAQPGRWWRLGWLAALLLVPPLSLELAASYLPALRFQIERIGPEVRFVLLDLIGILTWLTPKFAAIRSQLTEMEALQARAEEAQQKRAADPDVIAAQRAVTTAEAIAVAAEQKLLAAASLEQQLTMEAEQLRPDRRLTRFIENRARSADYRGQLGLVSLARRDFQELSDIFADRDALQAKLAALSDPKDVADLKKLSDSIDRIVLFVDDLDRCQPEKVVDVLQAVHLLLAYPLFAVVVGVDQRCLRQSLRMQFKGLLAGDEAAALEAGASGHGVRERPATPLDYLEKIFHIPFHLPAMDRDGFVRLMDNLSKPPSSELQSSGQRADVEDLPINTTPSVPRLATAGTAPTFAVSNPVPSSTIPPAPPASSTQTSPSPASGAPLEPARPRVVGSVPLQEWERIALKNYHPLVRTPRSATRLLNTYRLLRAGIPEKEWRAFRGNGSSTGDFRIAMLLLAAAAGSPAVARDWFHDLQTSDPVKLLNTRSNKNKTTDAEWLAFREVYSATCKDPSAQPTLADFSKWIEHVEQYAF